MTSFLGALGSLLGVVALIGGYVVLIGFAMLGFMASAFAIAEKSGWLAMAFVQLGMVLLTVVSPLAAAFMMTRAYHAGSKFFLVWLGLPPVVGLVWITLLFTVVRFIDSLLG